MLINGPVTTDFGEYLVDRDGKAITTDQVNYLLNAERRLGDFGGYVRTCLPENTPDWMEGLAEELNKVAAVLDFPGRFKFNGKRIIRRLPGLRLYRRSCL